MINKRKTKKGETRYDVRLRDPQGRTYNKTFRTKREAEHYRATQIAARNTGTWIDPKRGKITVAAWADEWLETNRHNWRPRTNEKHQMVIETKVKPTLGDHRLDQLTPQIIQRFVNTLADDYRPSTVNTYYRSFKQLINDALETDLIPKSPCRGIKLPQNKSREKRVINPAELHALADQVGPRWRCFIYMGGIMGLRFGEAAGLRFKDINLNKGTISVRQTVVETNGHITIGQPKTSAAARTITMPSQLIVELQQHYRHNEINTDDPDELVFANHNRDPIRRNNFRRRTLNPALEILDLEGLTFHGLRHSAATQWIAIGIDPKTVQHRLGHTDPRLTLGLYAHSTDQTGSEAASRISRNYWQSDK